MFELGIKVQTSEYQCYSSLILFSLQQSGFREGVEWDMKTLLKGI